MNVSPLFCRVTVFGAVFAMSGCGDQTTETSHSPPSSIASVELSAVSPRNVRITWSPIEYAEVIVARKAKGAGQYSVVGRKAASHARFLDLGLDPETTYDYQLTLCRDDECETPHHIGAVTTPQSVFPRIELTTSASGTNDDFVLFGVYRIAAELYREGHMAAIDRQGRIVWEYETYEWGPITEVQPLEDGTIATGQNMYLVQVDLDGREIYRWTQTSAHHDIDRLPDGRWAFLYFDPFESEPDYTRLSDGIAILNPEGNAIEWDWRARDHIPWTDFNATDLMDQEMGLGHDWTHGNAIQVDDAGTKVLVNVRNLNRIYQLDVATQQTDWIMGDGGDFGAGLWDHCHDPQFLDDRHVLIFDNGLRRSPKFSRVIEVEFDPMMKTADIVWEYRETPEFYSLALGSAQQQDNGNVFITDGINGRLLEVNREKEKLWEVLIQKYYWSYKAVTVPRSFFTQW